MLNLCSPLFCLVCYISDLFTTKIPKTAATANRCCFIMFLYWYESNYHSMFTAKKHTTTPSQPAVDWAVIHWTKPAAIFCLSIRKFQWFCPKHAPNIRIPVNWLSSKAKAWWCRTPWPMGVGFSCASKLRLSCLVLSIIICFSTCLISLWVAWKSFCANMLTQNCKQLLLRPWIWSEFFGPSKAQRTSQTHQLSIGSPSTRGNHSATPQSWH